MSLSDYKDKLQRSFKAVANVVSGKEKFSRSAIKTATWRGLAATDTFILSTYFTQDVAASSAIVASEFATKPLIYFLHERGWSAVQWGLKEKPGEPANQNIPPSAPSAAMEAEAPKEYSESFMRSCAKNVTYRVLGGLDTLGLSFLYTQDLHAAGSIAVAEFATKSVAYVLHERIWDRIKLGRKKGLANDNKQGAAPPAAPENAPERDTPIAAPPPPL